MTGLTRKQYDCLQFIKDRIASDGIAPSLQEIAWGLGYPTRSAAFRLLQMLEQRGAIRCGRTERGTMRARAIEIIEPNSVRVVVGTDTPAGDLANPLLETRPGTNLSGIGLDRTPEGFSCPAPAFGGNPSPAEGP